MRKLDDEMSRTDQLLYQMIPKAVADRLRKGEPAVNTCEVSPVIYRIIGGASCIGCVMIVWND